MEFNVLQDNLLKLQLDIEKVLKLGDVDKGIVMKMFDDLMDSFSTSMNVDYVRIYVLYNTLVESDYLVTRREKNLNLVLEKK